MGDNTDMMVRRENRNIGVIRPGDALEMPGVKIHFLERTEGE